MKHKFKTLFLVTTAAILSQSAYAASSYIHTNGSVVVDINKADKNGLSHNIWKEFNVIDKGMVLNNSTEDLTRPTGNIPKNDNLDVAAKVILNEVVSNKSTSLKGYIEVAGQTADVIIANPNGISCSGCGFINTSQATLTTGTPVFTNGALTGYNVAKGKISIDKGGLTHSGGFTDILANAITINDKVTTGSLNAIAGVYTYDNATKTTTTDNKRYVSPGIDVGQLGGVTAGIINLQTTNSGIGVNNKGALAADNLQITSMGNLTNLGRIDGQAVQLIAVGNVANSGIVNATSQSYLLGGQKITNSGKIMGGQAVQLISYAGNIENAGEITTSGTFIARTGYMQDENNQLKAVANTSIINSGKINTANSTLVATKEIALKKGTLTSSSAAILQAAAVNNAGQLIGGDITTAANNFNNTGLIQATDKLSVATKKSFLNTGTLTANTINLENEGTMQNKACSWLPPFSISGTIRAKNLNIIAPKISKLSNIGGKVYAEKITFNPKA